MLFTEFRFVVFFVVAFAVYWALKKNTSRKVWLLVCSYVFYGAWDWRFCGLMAFSTLVDYHAGRMLGQDDPPRGRKFWLMFSLTSNLGLLGFFKYFNFFVTSGQGLFDLVGLEFPVSTLEIILPVGISFYTFQTLSYTLDIYRRALKPVSNLLDFALFVGFFPQLVAGPIVRAVDFLPQLETRRRLASVDFRGCLTLFLIGFIKKACISDNLAMVADRYFESPELYDLGSAITAALYYAVQVYCDFSGYSDMAIATAGLLGYTLCLNFAHPFFSNNIEEFWKRWHISLSQWLRDYIFVSLLRRGRNSALLIGRNLMITFALCGLWHGASWNYVIFGLLHGAGSTFNILSRPFITARPRLSKVLGRVGPLITFYYVCITIVFFRPSGWEVTGTTLRAFVLFDAPGELSLGNTALWLFPCLVAVHWISYKRWFAGPWRRAPHWLCYTLWGAGVALALQWAAKDFRPFVYFQF